MQSAYLCVIFHVKHQKLTLLAFLTLFLILGKSRNRWQPRWWLLLLILQTSSSATTRKIYLILLRRSQAFHWSQNYFEILQHIKNSGEGFHLLRLPPYPPLYHGGGMNLGVRPRLKNFLFRPKPWVMTPRKISMRRFKHIVILLG